MTTTGERVRQAADRIRQTQGKAIRNARLAKGLTHRQVAEAIEAEYDVKCSAAAVSQWETGRTTPRAVMQLAIAKVLDQTWTSMFSLEGEAL